MGGSVALTRRGFLGLFGAAAGGILLEQAIPFGRVWSFPTNIVIARPTLTYADITAETVKYITASMVDNIYKMPPLRVILSGSCWIAVPTTNKNRVSSSGRETNEGSCQVFR